MAACAALDKAGHDPRDRNSRATGTASFLLSSLILARADRSEWVAVSTFDVTASLVITMQCMDGHPLLHHTRCRLHSRPFGSQACLRMLHSPPVRLRHSFAAFRHTGQFPATMTWAVMSSNSEQQRNASTVTPLRDGVLRSLVRGLLFFCFWAAQLTGQSRPVTSVCSREGRT